MLWLGLIAKNFYSDQIGFLLKSDINWVATAIFYLLFIAGLTFFVINPSLNKENPILSGLIMGGFLALSPMRLTILQIWRR